MLSERPKMIEISSLSKETQVIFKRMDGTRRIKKSTVCGHNTSIYNEPTTSRPAVADKEINMQKFAEIMKSLNESLS